MGVHDNNCIVQVGFLKGTDLILYDFEDSRGIYDSVCFARVEFKVSVISVSWRLFILYSWSLITDYFREELTNVVDRSFTCTDSDLQGYNMNDSISPKVNFNDPSHVPL